MQERRHTATVRKLAAIMFTDIVGYSSLMGKDEVTAFNLLTLNRSIHQTCIGKFKGKLIKEIGDGSLISFSLASDAVRCAIELQNACIDQGIPLKIGIHEGETLFTGTDVLGDTVNVAARLQETSSEGCIFISDTVYRSIKNKSDITVNFVEERNLKNIDELLKIYNVSCKELSSESINPIISGSTPPKEKSIIVLPFENMSPDPDQEYFSDGLTEEIIADLSYIKDLLVISRSSAMTFKRTKKKIKEIAREVNVHFVLEGSVRKAGNKLRITAQLIDGLSDTHLWAEKYNGTLDDIFNIQEEVSLKIADALKLKLSSEENQKIAKRPIKDVQVYEYYLKAVEGITKFSKERNNQALRYLQNAVDLAGDNAQLYGGIAFAYWNLVNIGVQHEDYLEKAELYAKKALILDPESSIGYVILGYVDFYHKKILESLFHFKKALKVNQDEIFALVGVLNVYYFTGKISDAVPYNQRLMQIDPLSFPANWCNGGLYYYDGKFSLALKAWERSYELHPENPFSQFMYALILVYKNRMDSADPLINQITKAHKDTVFAKLGLILKYALRGERDKISHEITADFQKTVSRDCMWSYHLSSFLSLINKKREAMDWLENAVEYGMINYPLLNEQDPLLENIRGEKRFKEIMKKVKVEWENFKE